MSVSDFRYLNDLILRRKKKGDGNLFYVENAYGVAFLMDNMVPITITIPPGFATDGPSVPGFLRSVVSALGPHFEAAVVHDFCYREGRFPRKTCDEIMLAGMESANVGWYTRYKIYWGVRAGGWKAWDSHREKD